jgi:hypothetical protein
MKPGLAPREVEVEAAAVLAAAAAAEVSVAAEAAAEGATDIWHLDILNFSQNLFYSKLRDSIAWPFCFSRS